MPDTGVDLPLDGVNDHPAGTRDPQPETTITLVRERSEWGLNHQQDTEHYDWRFYTAYESMLDWKRLGEYDIGERGLVGMGDVKNFLVKQGYNGATLYLVLIGIIIVGSSVNGVK